MLISQFVKDRYGITTEMWQRTIRDVPWQCRDEHFKAPSGRAFLFQESLWAGDMFKGSASQVWFLLPWLHFHMHQLVVDHNCAEWKCFAALLKVHYALRTIRNGGNAYDNFDQAQVEHHGLFAETWGELLRPKHHLRLHLASIYKKFGYLDSFPCEKKHQDYKTFLAQTQASLYLQGTGKISLSILGRMLMQNTEELSDDPWTNGILPPIYSQEEVNQAFPGWNARISRCYRLNSFILKPDIPVLWAQQAGITQFFALEDNTIFLIYEELIPLQSRIPWSKKFQCTGRWKAVDMQLLGSSTEFRDVADGDLSGDIETTESASFDDVSRLIGPAWVDGEDFVIVDTHLGAKEIEELVPGAQKPVRADAGHGESSLMGPEELRGFKARLGIGSQIVNQAPHGETVLESVGAQYVLDQLRIEFVATFAPQGGQAEQAFKAMAGRLSKPFFGLKNWQTNG
eukprot:s863_g35.t1